MKRLNIFKYIFFISILFSLSLTAGENHTNHSIKKVLLIEKWKPYYYVDKNGKASGYAIEVFEPIAKKLNIKYEYVTVNNWSAGMKLIKEKRCQKCGSKNIYLDYDCDLGCWDEHCLMCGNTMPLLEEVKSIREGAILSSNMSESA